MSPLSLSLSLSLSYFRSPQSTANLAALISAKKLFVMNNSDLATPFIVHKISKYMWVENQLEIIAFNHHPSDTYLYV